MISIRWVDANKGDDKSPKFRSRLVGREVRTDSSLDLLTPTPLLGAMEFLISMCVRGQSRSQNRRLRMIVRRGNFYAPSQREVYIEIPIETGKRAMKAWWASSISVCTERATRRSSGPRYTLELMKRSVCQRQGISSRSDLLWLRDFLGSKYEIKSRPTDERHAELVIKELGLATAEPVSTSSTTEKVEKPDEVLLSAGDSQDRPDLQYASRRVSQHMSKPTTKSMVMPKKRDTSVVLLDVSNIFTGVQRARICSALRTVTG